VDFTYHHNLNCDPFDFESKGIIKEYHYYVFHDKEHDTFFVQHAFELHWKHLQDLGVHPS